LSEKNLEVLHTVKKENNILHKIKRSITGWSHRMEELLSKALYWMEGERKDRREAKWRKKT